jgi:hypothetical protein
MDDYTYTRIQSERERKNLAHQGRSKKNGSKSRKCSLPSDHLTPKQLKALNGEVFTFAMNRPCKFEDLQQIDKTLIEEYLYTITDRFNATVVCISRMLGIPEATFYRWATENHINRPTRRSKFMTPEESQSWNDWLAQFGWSSGYHKPELYPVEFLTADTEEITAEPKETSTEKATTEIDFGNLLTSFTAKINNPEQLDELCRVMRDMLSRGSSISIKVEI